MSDMIETRGKKNRETHNNTLLLHSCHSTVQMNAATLRHVFNGIYVFYVPLGGLIGLAGRGGGGRKLLSCW